MRQNLTNLAKNEVLQGTVIVTLSILVGSVFSYFLQIFLARNLSLKEYGEFSALLSLTYIFAIPSTSLSSSIIKLVSELKAQEKFGVLSQLFFKLSFYLLICGFLIFLSITLIRVPIASYLNITTHSFITAFAFNIACSFFAVISASYLQGLLRFKEFSFINILSAFLRLLFPVILITLGFSVGGAYVGIGISMILSYFVGILFLINDLKNISNEEIDSHLKKLLKFSAVSLFMTLGMTLINNIDVVLVKHFFSEESSGLYSAVVTVGKVLLFGSSTVSIVMFPRISEAFTKGEVIKKKFTQFLYIQLIPILCGGLTFFLFPNLIIKTLFGEKFLQASPYLPLFSIFIGIYVLINFFLLFFLAIGKTGVFLFQIPVLILQFTLINIYHGSLYNVIFVNIIVSVLLLCILLVYYKVYAGVSNSSLLQKGENN